MNIYNFALGSYQTNSYILTADESSQFCVIIDTGLQNSELIEYLHNASLTPEALILTHGHADHIAGVRDLRKEFPDIKVAIHTDDAEMLVNPIKNLSALAGVNIKSDPADRLLEDGQEISFANIDLKVIHTPGHTPGGISLYNSVDQVVFSGDALFAGSIGRTDFPGGNQTKLIQSIKEKLLPLPGQTKVYPGHGTSTMITLEKTGNPYLV